MSEKIDLHIHTNASDGSMTPEEIFQMALQYKLKAISITDHNTIDSIEKGITLAKDGRIEFIPGIELTVNWHHQEEHLLGYFYDYRYPELVSFLRGTPARIRRRTAQKIIEKMRKMNVEVSMKEYDEVAKHLGSGSSPLLQLLIEKGYVKDTVGYIKKYACPGGPAHISNYAIADIKEAISLIHRAGGLAVLAHPGWSGEMRRTSDYLPIDDTVIGELVQYRLDGIEAFSTCHKVETRNYYSQIAIKHNLLVTAGSDFHSYKLGGKMGSVPSDYEYG